MVPMVFFITVLRAIAACLITNSHYTGIYPIDALANGGMTGNVIFFAVSGYCLCRIREGFPRWYGKRLLRCYLPVWLITAVYLLVGAFSLEAHGPVWWFLYPTGYHFVASIVLLYIPFYLLLRWEPLRKRLPQVMLAIAGAMLVYYLTLFDRSHLHIDDVRGLPARALYLESMLLGAWSRQQDQRFRDRFRWWHALMAVLLFGAEQVCRYQLSNDPRFVQMQLLIPILRSCQLYFTLRLFAGLDGRLQRLPAPVIRIIRFLADMTLEIYVVQGVLIDWLRPLFGFPLNWLVLTGSILLTAWLLHLASRFLTDLILKK